MKRIKIVIVDDHQMFLDGLVSFLNKQDDFEVIFSSNDAKVALEQLAIYTPDLIISDIAMPDMNGLEFIKLVKENHPFIKILVISMFSVIQNNTNIDGHLLKEVGLDELTDAIRKIVLKGEKVFNLGEIKEEYVSDFNGSILSSREKEIIKLIALEKTTDEISLQLNLSKYTIETHRKNIFLKLNVKNIAGLIFKAVQLGIVK